MFRAFDVYDPSGRRFLDLVAWSFPSMVPLLFAGPYDSGDIETIASGASAVVGANHIREGVVVRSAVERVHERYGRAVLKCVSNEYLERS